MSSSNGFGNVAPFVFPEFGMLLEFGNTPLMFIVLIDSSLKTALSSSHYCDVIISPTASQITSLTIVYSIVHSGTNQRKHQSSASLAFVRGIHWRPVKSPHKWPVMWKMFPFDDVILLVIFVGVVFCLWTCFHISWVLSPFFVSCSGLAQAVLSQSRDRSPQQPGLWLAEHSMSLLRARNRKQTRILHR